MIDVLIKIFPLDLASIFSPGILAIIIILLAKKDHGLARSIALGLGSLLVAILLAFLGLKLGQNVQDVNNNKIIDNIVDLILAAIFLYFGIKSLLHQDKEKHLKAVDANQSTQLAKWFLIGFAISITNFDAVIFNFSAAKEVGQSTINDLEKIILLAVNSLFFIAPILIPLVIYLLMPKLADKILEPVDKFLTKYGRYIIGIIFIGFAIYLIIQGLKGI